MWIFISSKLRFILILALLLPPAQAPQQVQLQWASPQAARIAWVHPDAGNYWAVLKVTPQGWLTVAESFDAEPGVVVVDMGPRREGRFDYSPRAGAHYLIQVAERDEGSHATPWSEWYGPFTLEDWPEGWVLLPVVRR